MRGKKEEMNRAFLHQPCRIWAFEKLWVSGRELGVVFKRYVQIILTSALPCIASEPTGRFRC